MRYKESLISNMKARCGGLDEDCSSTGSCIRTPDPQLVLLFMEVQELSGNEGFLEEVRCHGEGFESL